jgi:hypothetical protein
MDSIRLPRRQFLGQSGALVASAAVLDSALLMQAFAAQPGEEIIPWSDQPTADPGVARGVIQNLQLGGSRLAHAQQPVFQHCAL